jgi:hypothetical protein
LHYFSRRPLWLDENFILENIRSLKVPEILGPLSNSQAFPRIYLIVISKFAAQFGYDPLALRLFPLLSMFLAFFVWLKVYSIEIADRWGALLAVFSIACSYSFSYYAAELKHYSMDLLVAGIFCLYFINQRELMARVPSKGFIFFTLILPFTILVSYSSFFLFWIVIYNFFFIPRKGVGLVGVLCLYTLLSLVFLAFVYYFDMRHTLSTRPLFSYWDDYFISTGSFGPFFSNNIFLLSLLGIFFVLHRFDDHARIRLFNRKMPNAVKLPLIFALILLAIAIGTGSSAKFIYFDF